MKLQKVLGCFLGLTFSISFWACSDDKLSLNLNDEAASPNSSSTNGVLVCDESREGEIISTKDGGDRLCQDGKWILVIGDDQSSAAASKSSASEKPASSTSEKPASSASASPKSSAAVPKSSASEKPASSTSEKPASSASASPKSSAAVPKSTASEKPASSTSEKPTSSASASPKSSAEQDYSSSSDVTELYECEDGSHVIDRDMCLTDCSKSINESCEDIVGTLGLCTASRLDSLYSFDSYTLVCSEYGWDIADNAQQENWQMGEELEIGGCSAARSGEVIQGNDDVFYICRKNLWDEASVAEYNTYPEKCDKEGKTMNGLLLSKHQYICDESWREITESELTYGPCTKSNLGEIIEKKLKCSEDHNWRVMGLYDYEDNSYFFNEDKVYGNLVDRRDGKVYKTVNIGNQVWMAENLQYNPTATKHQGQTGCFNDIETNCNVGGRLYSWSAAMDIGSSYNKQSAEVVMKNINQGICPTGWHIPSYDEWNSLLVSARALTMDSRDFNNVALWSSIFGGSNLSGFSIVPTGGKTYSYMNPSRAVFWSSTEYSDMSTIEDAYTVGHLHAEGIRMLNEHKSDFLSVRCISDLSAYDYFTMENLCDANSFGSILKNSKDPSMKYVCLNEWNLTFLNEEATYDFVTDERDGKMYATLKIGEATWFAQNLSYQSENSIVVKPSNSLDAEIFGTFYTKSDAVGESGENICPEGWRVPTLEDWEYLRDNVDDFSGLIAVEDTIFRNASVVPAEIKSIPVGTNETAFSALRTGVYSIVNKNLLNEGYEAFWWINSSEPNVNYWHMYTGSDTGVGSYYGSIKTGSISGYAMPVRCVK